MIRPFKFLRSWFLKRERVPPTGGENGMETYLAKVIYSGPDDRVLLCLLFKNPARCSDMLRFIMEEVEFSYECGAYSIKHYDLSGEEQSLEKIYYTLCDSPRTWFYLANFKGL